MDEENCSDDLNCWDDVACLCSSPVRELFRGSSVSPALFQTEAHSKLHVLKPNHINTYLDQLLAWLPLVPGEESTSKVISLSKTISMRRQLQVAGTHEGIAILKRHQEHRGNGLSVMK